MIKRYTEMGTETRENIKGGVGPYESLTIFSQAELSKTKLFAINEMPPRTSIGIHTHTTEGEAYLILEGEAVVHEDGEDFILRTGDAEYCTGGHCHGIANRSDAPMKFLAIIIE